MIVLLQCVLPQLLLLSSVVGKDDALPASSSSTSRCSLSRIRVDGDELEKQGWRMKKMMVDRMIRNRITWVRNDIN